MTAHPFKQVDVFTSVPLKGNPVAVVFSADEMSDAEMLQLAAWTNLSETTFLCQPTQPGADYLLRIFHPTGELPFAGHPTVGSAHAALELPACPMQIICGRKPRQPCTNDCDGSIV